MTKVEDRKERKNTLRQQFVFRMLIVLLTISGLSAVFQYYYLGNQIDHNVKGEAIKIAYSIEQGIHETNSASRAIENQLDLRLKVIAQRVSDRLGTKTIDNITNEELKAISEEFDIAGITIFAQQEDDIVGVKSTAPSDIGFSFKKTLGPENEAFIGISNLLNGKEITQSTESYVDQNTIILYTTQSGSNQDETSLYKYAYYHGEGQDYVINPYIEANEVYQFTQKVGPNNWIEKVLKTNSLAKEVAVLDPNVYADPSLAEKLYPPLQKVVYGEFNLADRKDEDILASIAKEPKETAYITEIDSRKIYKMFIPMDNGKVIFVALDYTAMILPVKKISTFLLITSFISLLAMFILSTQFFNSIYKNIQVIISQIKKLELGDFTSRSEVKGKGELADLSASTNHMTETLNKVLRETTKEASKVQRMSLGLKEEADESVEKVYDLSIDLTSKAREDAYNISDFLELVEEKIKNLPNKDDIEHILLKTEEIRQISDNRSESTTDITITLFDLLKSLQNQSDELSEISSKLFENMYKFKL
ncbi:methyl-accepting chemotaxis protein [Lysinibacillus telephonicus]|uniref:methyl-accepting chemotaxis protein n=1 Tax=Lysinibacillus telephonicus TaxID=1714840 RepID=UPI0039795EA8